MEKNPDDNSRFIDDLNEIIEKLSKKLGAESKLTEEPNISTYFLQGNNDKTASKFIGLNEFISKLDESDMIVIGARPNMGKTTLAVNLAADMAIGSGKSILFFSPENPTRNLVQTLLSSESGVTVKRLQGGKLSIDDWVKLLGAVSRISNSKIMIDDRPKITVPDIEKAAIKAKKAQGLELIIIDHLQLISSETGQDFSEIVPALKQVAVKLDVPVICFSQLSRTVENRADKKPIISDLLFYKIVEKYSDVIAFLYRHEYYYPGDKSQNGKTELIVRKNRDGELVKIPLKFNTSSLRFEHIKNFK